MDRDEAVAYIARRLGNRTDLDSAIANELALAQTELEHSPLLPWFLLDSELYTTLATGTTRVELPAGFLREYEEGALWTVNADESEWTALQKVPIDKLRQLHTLYSSQETDSETAPLYYSTDRTYFHLTPPPAADVTLRILCYTADSTLPTGDSTNDWLTHAPEILLAKTGMRMSQYLQNATAYQVFAGQYAEATRALEVSTVAREVSGSELTMGGS
jgi:hypothetical protein